MGIFDWFKAKAPPAPALSSVLPDAARQEILRGRLPILKTDKLFLKRGEICHYADKALYEKKIVQKRYVRRGNTFSTPGLFGAGRLSLTDGRTDVVDNIQYESLKGILYITNQRILFVGANSGFEKKISELVAITPYGNAVELQFAKENITLFVPDGTVVNAVLQQVK